MGQQKQSRTDEEIGLMFLSYVGTFILGVLVMAAMSLSSCTPDYKVTSGKEFIIEKASYKCTKTNELLGKKL